MKKFTVEMLVDGAGDIVPRERHDPAAGEQNVFRQAIGRHQCTFVASEGTPQSVFDTLKMALANTISIQLSVGEPIGKRYEMSMTEYT